MRVDLFTPRAAAWIVGLLCGIGFGLRVFGLAFGLPSLYHPDEIPILNVALAFAKPDLNPHRFLYPTLYYYALFIWEGLFFAAGRVVGLYGSVSAFQREFFTDPTHLVLAGRALTAVFGTATIAAVYRFGARLYDRATGVGAAAFLAVAPFAVRDAHYIKHDVPVTFFITATLAALAAIVVDPAVAARRRAWCVAGALAGLAMSTHWYAIVIVVPIVATAIADVPRSTRWQTSFRLLVWAGIASVIAFFAASPFMLVEPHTVMRDLAAVKGIDIDASAARGGPLSSVAAYARMLATDAIGVPVAAAAAAGLVLALRRDWRRGLLLASFPLAFLAFLATTVPMNRYVNAMLPSMAVAAAWSLARVSERLPGWKPGFLSVVLVATLPGAIGSLRSDVFFRRADTRTQAEQYIEQEIPGGASILIQPYSVQPRVSHASLIEALTENLGDPARASVKFRNELSVELTAPTYRLLYLGDHTDNGSEPDKIFVSPKGFDGPGGRAPLDERRVDYVVLKRYNSENSALASLDVVLAREGSRIATFSPYASDVTPDVRASVAPFDHHKAGRIDRALDRPGPTIEIWRINHR